MLTNWKPHLLIAATLIVVFLVLARGVFGQDDTGTLLQRIDADDVWLARVQVDDGRDTRLYQQSSVGWCDVSRPPDVRVCGIDVPALLQLLDMPVLEYVPSLPKSVAWTAWDWQTMTTKPGGYTPVALVVDLRAYDVASDTADLLYLACSRIPLEPQHGACYIGDRLDHGNYVVVRWSDLAQVIEWVG